MTTFLPSSKLQGLNCSAWGIWAVQGSTGTPVRPRRPYQSEIAPKFHRPPERINAHGLIGFLAPVLHRAMLLRLEAKGHAESPERAPQMLHQVQRHRIHLAYGI